MTTAAITEATYQASADFLTSNLPDEFQSMKLGVICGSGLGGLVDTIDQSTKIEFLYKDIPGFVASTGKLRSDWAVERKRIETLTASCS